MISGCTNSVIRPRGSLAVSKDFAVFLPAMINLMLSFWLLSTLPSLLTPLCEHALIRYNLVGTPGRQPGVPVLKSAIQVSLPGAWYVTAQRKPADGSASRSMTCILFKLVAGAAQMPNRKSGRSKAPKHRNALGTMDSVLHKSSGSSNSTTSLRKILTFTAVSSDCLGLV